MSMVLEQPAPTTRDRAELPVLDAHLVLLNNYLRPHHVAVYQALARRVRRLTVLVSTAMEADRAWTPEWGDLDVRVQKNWVWTRYWKHQLGFKDANYVHIPWDTPWQLMRLKPDLIGSYEYGPRTAMACFYRFLFRRSRLVVIGNMSEHIEPRRGMLRKGLRAFIRRFGDRFTFNGQGCRRYLCQIGIDEARLGHFPYFVDAGKVFRGAKEFPSGLPIRLLYCGVLEKRKGLHFLIEALGRWCVRNPDRRIELQTCGTGSLDKDLAALTLPNLVIRQSGNADDAALREAYATNDLCVFPSLADEWGLVPIEAMMSGLPVLGSIYAQSVTDLIRHDVNGWQFRPDSAEDFDRVLDRALNTPAARLEEISARARSSVGHITPEWAAGEFLKVLAPLLPQSSRKPLDPTFQSGTSSE